MCIILKIWQKIQMSATEMSFKNHTIKITATLPGANELTPKHRETHGCIVSTVATVALVLKHQAISIHNAD